MGGGGRAKEFWEKDGGRQCGRVDVGGLVVFFFFKQKTAYEMIW